MRFTDFVNALHESGWEGIRDAQHSEIEKLWAKLWPVVAELEDELKCRENDIHIFKIYRD